MTNAPPATPEDLTKLMVLLQEYTQKLRIFCEERVTMRYRREQISMIITVGFIVLVAALVPLFLSVLTEQKSTDFFRSIFPLAVAAIFVPFAWFMWSQTGFGGRSTRHLTSDVEQVAATVERLIKLASQYAEHSQLRIADRFEYELRLAEAEGALKTFHRVFRIELERKQE